MTIKQKALLVVISTPLDARVFLNSGVIRELRKAYHGPIEVLITFDLSVFSDQIREHSDIIRFLTLDEIMPRYEVSLVGRILVAIDRLLDKHIGYFPLAIRFNLRNELHPERMLKGHPNTYLDPSKMGFLPQWTWIYNAMFKWLYCRYRYLQPDFLDYLRKNTHAILTTSINSIGQVPFILGAKRLGIPLVGYVASWDHPVGKGVMYPDCLRYIVQNGIMKNDLLKYHAIDAEKIAITGWPQTDVFAIKHPRSEYERLLTSCGLDPVKPCVLITGNSKTNAPYEPAFFKRLVAWWQTTDAKNRFSLYFRPHPKDNLWETRLNVKEVIGIKGIYVQSPSFTDMEEVLAPLLQHSACVVTNAGTVLLDSLVNDRPVVSVLYDEGAPAGTCFAAKNVTGLHYKELMSSEAFYVAVNFDQVVDSINRCLNFPDELADQRRAVCLQIVGNIDGMAAQRVANVVADAIYAL